MRFVFFCGHFFPHLGGVERYTEELATRLCVLGHGCWVVTNNTNRAPPEEESGGIRVVRLPSWNILSGEFPVTLPSSGLFRLLREIREWRPDWIVTNTRYFPVNQIAAVANSILFRARHLHIEHGSDRVRLARPLFSFLGGVFDRLFSPVVLRRADLCAGVSPAVNEFLLHAFRRRCDGILRNAIDAASVKLSGPTFRDDLGIGEKEIVFGYAGRLIPEKGVLEVLRAFRNVRPRLAARGVSPRLLIAGTGPLGNEVDVEAGADPAIHILGPLPSAAMERFYRTIDMFVYPTSYPEGFPTVILEAGGYGKIVITTERGSARDAILDPSHGTIVPPHDSGALEQAMADHAIRFEDAKSLGANLRRVVCARFDWGRTVRDFLDLVGDRGDAR